MELGLKNFAVILPIEKSRIRFNKNKLNRFIAENCTIPHGVVQRLFQQNVKISHHRHIQKLCQRK
jgi:hypothetical protein